MSRLVQIVADYGPGDLAHAELIQRLELAAPDCIVHLTPVATGDTLAAGFCVARLALGEGPPDRIVAHDVGAPKDAGDRLWAGRSRSGVWIVGPDSGYSWSSGSGVRTPWAGSAVSDVPSSERTGGAVPSGTSAGAAGRSGCSGSGPGS